MKAEKGSTTVRTATISLILDQNGQHHYFAPAWPEFFPVVLSGPVEDNGSSGHVYSHGKRLCGEEDLHQTAAEAYLHNLLMRKVLHAMSTYAIRVTLVNGDGFRWNVSSVSFLVTYRRNGTRAFFLFLNKRLTAHS